MDKKDVGKRIKAARALFHKRHGIKLTQQLLAEKTGISRSYIGDIESGRTYPTFVTIKAISNACGVPVSFFMEDNPGYIKSSEAQGYEYKNTAEEDCIPSPDSRSSLKTIPILGLIRAGEPISACQNIVGYEYIPYDMAKGGEYFGLKVMGDSMNNSRIFDGDTVLVRRQDEVENGEIAVVMVDSENATIKKFYKTDSVITLVPDSSNKDHQPRFFDITKIDIKVLGKVVKVIISL
ncbi:repressor LexA [Anaerobacterium chartisolvens]|uniref:Repressor LexA n=1 Tax=Anaerobacterium chartisolvens TaxID=1297424 RepID=A0A369AYJ3_9FIRM|nr:LexA family transcriptional regulator [Anaerobacterium chartisolvens]RCX13257.1 repressor LexA [Anaerobacterium chartisolvens]